MDIHEATRSYERWLKKQIAVLADDLEAKHEAMGESPFAFLRATFYRWIQRWPQLCGELASAPKVLAVGDLHVENFGTWRDAEGRLVWGVNDFDEAYPLPYTQDMVRLTASALIAIALEHLRCHPDEAANAVMEGYVRSIEGRGNSWVLAEKHGWLRRIALNEARDPERFWERLEKWPDVEGLPAAARRAIERVLPKGAKPLRVIHRRAGLGSLGRPRYTMICEWGRAKIARETKPLLASACVWAGISGGKGKIFYEQIVESSIRPRDPFLQPRRRWIARRLSPDCSRVELHDLPDLKHELELLAAMGSETANIHLGTAGARSAIQKDLAKRHGHWLRDAAQKMVDDVTADFEAFRKVTAKERSAPHRSASARASK